MRSFVAASALVLALGGAAAAATPSVAIDSGKVNGGVCSGEPGAVFFKGIPYAKPPVKGLRFKPPKPYGQRFPGGALDATIPPPACIQFGKLFAEPGQADEDCLYLDIWVPANATKDCDLPVRVWLYGGSNADGGISDPLYDGCNVARSQAIMVSINYRLGPLGFLSLEKAGFSGNQGIQDALLGLQWVQDNIAAFGGDPKKVLLHGQSAGAIDAFTISTLPQASKLISAGIFESGGGRDIQFQNSVEQISDDYARYLKCDTAVESCLQNAQVSSLKLAYTNLPALNRYQLGAVSLGNITTPGFGPCLDGKVISKQPSVQGSRVPSVFGSTSREGALFALGQYESSSPANATAADYATFLHENFGNLDRTIEKYYPVSAFNATPFPAFFAIAQVITDFSYFCPARRGMEITRSSGQPTWTYLFQHSPKCIWIPGIPEIAVQVLGPAHTSEIPFMLGNTEHLPQPNGTCTMSDEEKQISSFMVQAWDTMARQQKPGSAADWPAWTDAKSSRGINILNSSIPGYVDYSRCALWDKIRDIQFAQAAKGSGGAQ